MDKSDEMVLVLTASKVVIDHVRAELDANGIGSLVKDGFTQGLQAGFVGGDPSAIELYVLATEEERAIEIIDDVTD
jgi:hypothetical protein